jgi:DNA mismatch repair protein MutS
MILGTDRQTISDLNIFSQKRGSRSVFDYYNCTQTILGKELLLRMMDSPLNDLNEINSRIVSIKFLHNNDLYCELDKKDLDGIEYYLKLETAILKNNILDSLHVYVANFVRPNNDYYLIFRGLKCLYQHLYKLIEFFEFLDVEELPDFLAQCKKDVESIKYHPDFSSFMHRKKTKLNFRQISRFDNLIRKQKKETILKILESTYLLDVYNSMAAIATEKGLGFPTFVNDINAGVKIEGFFHPLVDNPVKNDIYLTDNKNLCFVSGANMAGKSTSLKSIGLCVYLAHIGFPVPAKSMETPIFNGLYTTINISDNISAGYSHYYSEVKRIKDIVLFVKEKKRVFVIFDELFRGTNVKDAFDASLMVTEGFTKLTNSVFFISTHIVEVGQELEKSDKICFKCFESDLQGEQAIYNYKLKDGISSERLGLTILKNERIIELMDEISENNCQHLNEVD